MRTRGSVFLKIYEQTKNNLILSRRIKSQI